MSSLKNKPPYPFETIAVAIAFSPRMKAVLAEAARIAQVYDARLFVFHIGKKGAEEEKKMNALLTGLPAIDVEVCWKDGAVVETLLNSCKFEAVDLLVLGALEKESVLKYYLGSVARKISRKAKCSILLLTEPKVAGTQFKKMVVSGVEHPKTLQTLSTAIYMAEKERAEELYLLKEEDSPTLGIHITEGKTNDEIEALKRQYRTEADQRCKNLLDKLPSGGGDIIKTRVVFGKPGHSIRNFAKAKDSDLIIINSPDKEMGLLDRVFPHDMEHLLAELPCNLLIVHSRGN